MDFLVNVKVEKEIDLFLFVRHKNRYTYSL